MAVCSKKAHKALKIQAIGICKPWQDFSNHSPAIQMSSIPIAAHGGTGASQES